MGNSELQDNKPKIFLVSPMLHQGGFERVCVTTARLLEPYFDITIVIFDDADIAYDISGLKIVNFDLGVTDGKINKIRTMLKRSKKLKALINTEKPIAVYSFGSTANLVNSLSKVKNVKMLVGLRSYMDMLSKASIKLFTKRADLMVCCSRVIEDELNSKYGFTKTCTLYNPYNVEKIVNESYLECDDIPWGDYDSEGRRIITLVTMGREDDVKGYWHAVKAFSVILEKIPNCRLMFIGDGDFSKYEKLCEDLNIKDKVFFAGLQTNPYKYLRRGDIYLLTSENEGFPNALVEGMLLGLAPVCVDCMTGPREITKDGEIGILLPEFTKGINLDPNDITDEDKAFAEAVLSLIENPEKLFAEQKKAAERAADFSDTEYTKQLIQYLS